MNRVWWKEAVAYQIYPRSFCDRNGDGIGDIQGIISKLDYLRDLGIDVIWVGPMYQSPNDDNGYDISDYHGIMPEFGTMADFDKLLQEVHQRGMKLILDLVINHTSDEHPWFIESKSSKTNPKRDWYIWRDGKADQDAGLNHDENSLANQAATIGHSQPPNNWESIFGGSVWEYDPETDQHYLHLFSRKQPDLNWENPEVRQSLYQMIHWWLEKGIDGFRVDAISHIKKEPGFPDLPNPKGLKYVPSFKMHMNVKGIHRLLQELKENTFARYDIMTVGEANGVKVDDIDVWVSEEKGAFNMIFQFEHLALWDVETKKELDIVELKEVLSRWQIGLEGKGWNALFLENHDKPRIVSTWGDDQQYWRESATALASMYFLMKGTPFIYQGQEIGMTNVQYATIDDYNDVATKSLYKQKQAEGVPHQEIMDIIWASSRDNSRTPMQWSADDDRAGFMDGNATATPWLKVNHNFRKINVANQLSDPTSVLSFYKKMIALRKENPVFTYGTYALVMEKHRQIYAYTRVLGSEMVIVLANLSGKTATVRKRKGFLYDFSQLLLSNYEVAEHKPVSRLRLQPFETRVYRLHC